MAKEKVELSIEEIIEKKDDDINSILLQYEEKLDTNYQTFLKALFSEIEIINLISSINEKKVNENQKNRIKSIKEKFYNRFLSALDLTINRFSETKDNKIDNK